MKSAANLISLVREIIDDTDIQDATILSYFNEAFNLVAEKLTPATLMVGFEPFELEAGEPGYPLPESCIPEKILTAHNADKKPIPVFYRLQDAEPIFQKTKDTDNYVAAILVVGNQIRPIPTPSVDMRLYLSYIKYPQVFEDLLDDGQEVTFLPKGLAEKLAINYAAAMCYRMLEDGATDQRLNFNMYFALAKEAMMEIEAYFLPHANQSRPDFIQVGNEPFYAVSSGRIFNGNGGL
jgi:hypothetical protein